MIIAALHRNISMAFIIDRKLLPKTLARQLILQIVMSLVIFATYYISFSAINLETITVVSWIISAMTSAVALFAVSVVIYLFVDLRATKTIVNKVKCKLLHR